MRLVCRFFMPSCRRSWRTTTVSQQAELYYPSNTSSFPTPSTHTYVCGWLLVQPSFTPSVNPPDLVRVAVVPCEKGFRTENVEVGRMNQFLLETIGDSKPFTGFASATRDKYVVVVRGSSPDGPAAIDPPHPNCLLDPVLERVCGGSDDYSGRMCGSGCSIQGTAVIIALNQPTSVVDAMVDLVVDWKHCLPWCVSWRQFRSPVSPDHQWPPRPRPLRPCAAFRGDARRGFGAWRP